METNKKPSNPDLFKDNKSLLEDRVRLRDYFANSAMQGILSTYSSQVSFQVLKDQAEHLSISSYVIADAMLKQREL